MVPGSGSNDGRGATCEFPVDEKIITDNTAPAIESGSGEGSIAKCDEVCE